MSGYELKRREFIQVLLSLPLGYAVACTTGTGNADREALRRIVMALGPWQDLATAAEFATRFVAADHMVGMYLPDSVRDRMRRVW